MNALDPCPDDLLARAANAPLAPAERSLLAAHLDRCASCRAAADVVEALADEPSALPGDERLVARMAERAAGRRRVSRRSRRPIRIAATALVTAAALAGVWHLARRSPSRPAAGAAATPAASPAVPAQPQGATPLDPPTDPPAANERQETAPPPAPRRASPEVDVDRLLAEARAARARGENARARTLYARVARLAAGKPAAAVAEMAIGLLLLERAGSGDARAALEAFDRYLAAAPAGALREEALAGRARALERLGDRARAAGAWRELLDEHPRSLQAPLARSRLEALGAEPTPKATP